MSQVCVVRHIHPFVVRVYVTDGTCGTCHRTPVPEHPYPRLGPPLRSGSHSPFRNRTWLEVRVERARACPPPPSRSWLLVLAACRCPPSVGVALCCGLLYVVVTRRVASTSRWVRRSWAPTVSGRVVR